MTNRVQTGTYLDFRIPSSTSPSTSVTFCTPTVTSSLVKMTVGSSVSNQFLAQGVTDLDFQCQFAVDGGSVDISPAIKEKTNYTDRNSRMAICAWAMGESVIFVPSKVPGGRQSQTGTNERVPKRITHRGQSAKYSFVATLDSGVVAGRKRLGGSVLSVIYIFRGNLSLSTVYDT
jgi:hypothetical protein